ncbi:response regulator transcription factor [Gallaecimonas mangrovi]|uniref:response regulator transcription factor n=1 Tax=Gallaecimonas mangrovi TaxID=2291597 RepID=UPI000E20B8FB|nr:response regulator [Gallaecimonas mangrovi]
MNILLVQACADLDFTGKCQQAGLSIAETVSFQHALDRIWQGSFELVLVDLDNEADHGLEFIEQFRQARLVTALVAVASKAGSNLAVNALDNGADLFLYKDTCGQEAQAQFNALVRRCGHLWANKGLSSGDYVLSLSCQSLRFEGHSVYLTQVEFLVLEIIFKAKGLAVAPDTIISTLTAQGHSISQNALQVHLSCVRKKVREKGGLLPIINRRGLGYATES